MQPWAPGDVSLAPALLRAPLLLLYGTGPLTPEQDPTANPVQASPTQSPTLHPWRGQIMLPLKQSESQAARSNAPARCFPEAQHSRQSFAEHPGWQGWGQPPPPCSIAAQAHSLPQLQRGWDRMSALGERSTLLLAC